MHLRRRRMQAEPALLQHTRREGKALRDRTGEEDRPAARNQRQVVS